MNLVSLPARRITTKIASTSTSLRRMRGAGAAEKARGSTKQNCQSCFGATGGGWVDGESNDYDGSKLASQGNTVVVTFNYRLNLFGFLAHPALDSEGHLFGNYGILDNQFALRWVHDNIGNFGGDPNNVTILGQSAGSRNSASQVLSPLSKGLLRTRFLKAAQFRRRRRCQSRKRKAWPLPWRRVADPERHRRSRNASEISPPPLLSLWRVPRPRRSAIARTVLISRGLSPMVGYCRSPRSSNISLVTSIMSRFWMATSKMKETLRWRERNITNRRVHR